MYDNFVLFVPQFSDSDRDTKLKDILFDIRLNHIFVYF